MFTMSYEPKKKITPDFSWEILKYGLCSYFVLAYQELHPERTEVLAVMEYDTEMEKEYLAHFLIVLDDNLFLDAEGIYDTWEEAMKPFCNLDWDNLRTRKVDRQFVIDLIEIDMGYQEIWHQEFTSFVKTAYR